MDFAFEGEGGACFELLHNSDVDLEYWQMNKMCLLTWESMVFEV